MNKSKQLFLLFSLTLLVFSGSIYSQSSAKAKKINDFIMPFVKANTFSGQILAADNGKIIYDKAFGVANADFKIPNQLNTRIGIASITKYFTVVILNRLIESNKISLGDKLSKYIPDFPNGDKITIEMLSRHRSGIPHRVTKPSEEAVSVTSEEMVEKIKKAKLEFEPGTKNLYSSAGYTVLARTLEIASGKSYNQLLQEYVFTPADMKDSVNFNGEMIIDRRAQDYMLDSEGLINAPLKDYSFLVGAGSVFSTAQDVYKFGEAVLDGKFGEAAKIRLVGQNNISGSGSTNGHRSYFEIEKNNKYGYSLVSNLGSGAFEVISQGLTDILQGKEVSVKNLVPPKIIPNPNRNLEEFSGHFSRSDGGGAVDVIIRNGWLYAGDIKLNPIRPDCFFDYKFFGEACFVRNNSGKIKEITWKGLNFNLLWVKQ